jgi:hypothetical protein
VYTVKLAGIVYVLHVFQKKSKTTRCHLQAGHRSDSPTTPNCKRTLPAVMREEYVATSRRIDEVHQT